MASTPSSGARAKRHPPPPPPSPSPQSPPATMTITTAAGPVPLGSGGAKRPSRDMSLAVSSNPNDPKPPTCPYFPPWKPRDPNEKFLSAVSAVGEEGEFCKTFIFRKEGHTLGNALRSIISLYPDVEMCAYALPHPAEDVMNFRIQSRGTPAVEVLARGFEDLLKVCGLVETRFKDAVLNREVDTIEVIDLSPPTSSTSTPTTGSGTFLKPKAISLHKTPKPT